MSSNNPENNEEAEALISDNDSQELNNISSDDETFTESDDESHVKKFETDVGIPLESHYSIYTSVFYSHKFFGK